MSVIRKFFGRRREFVEPPFLLKIPKESFENFVQINRPPDKREEVGLERLFKTSFPLRDQKGVLFVDYLGYEIGDWKCIRCGFESKSSYDFLGGKGVTCPKCKEGKLELKTVITPKDAKERGLSYEAPLRVLLRLRVKTKEGWKTFPPRKIYCGTVPLMTEEGSFILNGTERIVVNQLIRSSGLFLEEKEERQKYSTVIRKIYRASVIAEKGMRIDFELSGATDQFWVRIDRRKMSGTNFLRAFGYERAYDILKPFYSKVYFYEYDEENDEFISKETGETLSKEELLEVGEHYHIFALLKYNATLEEYNKEEELIEERYLERGVESLENLFNSTKVKVIGLTLLPKEEISRSKYQKVVFETLKNDTKPREPRYQSPVKIPSRFRLSDVGLIEIYKKIRHLESIATMEIDNLVERARSSFDYYFKNIQKYDLSEVGRVKLNAKVYDYPKKLKREDLKKLSQYPTLVLAQDYGKYKTGTVVDEKVLEEILKDHKEVRVKDYTGEEARFLNEKDVINILKALIELRFGQRIKDDVAHLGNRRVRPVGELLEAEARNGMAKVEKAFRDKANIVNVEDPNLKVQELVNLRYITTSITDFLKTGSLSQYLDNTNPLTSLTHKRRLSALGPGGLKRESAKFEIRDVHPSHYGRICPIETPEGQNIGLVTSPTVYAQTNELGFLITPYRKVEKGVVKDEVEYLAAYEEEKFVIAQTTPTDENGKILSERVLARFKNDVQWVKPEQVDYMEVSPRQVVSPSSSLIPFLEHDDANRALMGSNMQRQAVPLIFTEPPLVGTGMESRIARDSMAVVLAKRGGEVVYVDSSKIVIRVNPEEIDYNNPLDVGIDIYYLKKFERTNQKTNVNQRPLVRKGQRVKKGDLIADGQSTYKGELALGKNVLVAFMPWRGYNFEDAIVISERLVRDDVYTSIHVEEVEVEVRETKNGPEEITRDITGVPKEALRNLDEFGIVRIGSYVKPGDILVGKLTPVGETQLTPEEKLLRAIFGEKSKEFKNTSLRCPHGLEGIVMDVRIYTKRETSHKRSKLSEFIEQEELEELKREEDMKVKVLREGLERSVFELVKGKDVERDFTYNRKKYKKGSKIDEELFERVKEKLINEPEKVFEDSEIINKISELRERFKTQLKNLERLYREKKEVLLRRPLPYGTNFIIKVYIAQKRKIKVGDKMAGRHGNKGVISVVLPVEDMPFLEDGTPVDIVLNPLGVPSRMNIGQILETHLGWACKELGKKVAKLLDEENWRQKVESFLERVYSVGDKKGENVKFLRDYLSKLSDEELKELVREFGRLGIPVATPVFEGAEERDVKELLKLAGLPESGKVKLYDGRTGEPFDFEVTVGYMYMLKLIHMVDDKIHARSTGPYSLVTQQPLGGKAQFGGQRLGEMEVWALEAHGAAYTLQEMLTVKSDDIKGRTKVYRAIVEGKYRYKPGIPESFKVMVKELKALSLDVRCKDGEDRPCDSIKEEGEENE